DAWSSQADGPFLLRGRRPLYAPRLAHQLASGAIASLAERVASEFARSNPQNLPKILVGSIPYDRNAHDAIYRPHWVEDVIPAGLATGTAGTWAVRGEPTAEGYAQA